MQNDKCKMQNDGVGFADDFNYFRRKYLNSAFLILHSAFRALPAKLKFELPQYRIGQDC